MLTVSYWVSLQINGHSALLKMVVSYCKYCNLEYKFVRFHFWGICPGDCRHILSPPKCHIISSVVLGLCAFCILISAYDPKHNDKGGTVFFVMCC